MSETGSSVNWRPRIWPRRKFATIPFGRLSASAESWFWSWLTSRSCRRSSQHLLDTHFYKAPFRTAKLNRGVAGCASRGCGHRHDASERWHSDKSAERRWHTVIPLLFAGVAYVLLPSSGNNFPLAMALLILGGGFFFAYYPVFWSMPTMVLSESAAAASFGLINSVGHTGGLVGPYVVGRLNQFTGRPMAAFLFIGVCYLLAGVIISFVRIRNPIEVSAGVVSVRD